MTGRFGIAITEGGSWMNPALVLVGEKPPPAWPSIWPARQRPRRQAARTGRKRTTVGQEYFAQLRGLIPFCCGLWPDGWGQADRSSVGARDEITAAQTMILQNRACSVCGFFAVVIAEGDFQQTALGIDRTA